MKINDNYIIQNIAGEYLVVPIAEEVDKVQGVISLNETSAFLWNKIIDGCSSKTELRDALLQEYRVDVTTAENDIDSFLEALESIGCLES